MKNLLTLIVTLCFAYTAQAQQPQIALHHNGSSSFFTSATTAMTAAQNGDTLYFPGGSFGNINIDKQLVIYGTGIHTDSTSATGVSRLTNVYFKEGSSNSKIQGLSIVQMFFSPNNQTNKTLEDITIRRCYIASTSGTYTVYMATTYLDTLRNITFNENIIRGYQTNNYALYYNSNVHYDNIHFNKNIINYRISGARNTYFFNNIFLGVNSGSSSYRTFNNVKDCYFFNNYFNSSFLSSQLGNTPYLENCAFNNNLFRGSVTFPYVSNFGINNQINQTEANTFESAISYSFSFSYDYHLKATSTGKNAGFDGTDIGIYGTAVPTQEGWLPDNPHVIFKSISNLPDVNGNLPVQVKVRAVDNQ